VREDKRLDREFSFTGLDHPLLVDEAFTCIAINAQHSPIGFLAGKIFWVTPQLAVTGNGREEVIHRGRPAERLDPYLANANRCCARWKSDAQITSVAFREVEIISRGSTSSLDG